MWEHTTQLVRNGYGTVAYQATRAAYVDIPRSNLELTSALYTISEQWMTKFNVKGTIQLAVSGRHAT